MNPIMFRGDEYKALGEVMREMEHERLFGQNPTVKVWAGLGSIIVALVVAGLWLG